MIRSVSARIGALFTANCIAALSVAVLTLTGFWISAIISPGDGGMSAAIGWGLMFGLIAAVYSFVIAFAFFLVGLITVGIPTWWALHQADRRRRRTFIVVAAIESVIAGAIIFRLFVPGSEIFAPLLALPGGLAGWAIWTYGYVPIRPPPAPPA